MLTCPQERVQKECYDWMLFLNATWDSTTPRFAGFRGNRAAGRVQAAYVLQHYRRYGQVSRLRGDLVSGRMRVFLPGRRVGGKSR